MSDTITTAAPKPAKPDIRFAVTISDSQHYSGDRQYRNFRAEA